MALTAGAAAPVLLRQLERAGWGDLAGPDLKGTRAVLWVLARTLPPASAEGKATVEQLAAAAGYCTRWTASRLGMLEQLGIIRWTRGGVANGKPQPSLIRLSKRRLLALVQHARQQRDEHLGRLREQTRQRLAGLRSLNVRRRGQNRRSVHVEVATGLPPDGEDPPAAGRGGAPPPDPLPAAHSTAAHYAAQARAAIRSAQATTA
jgi:hypothetical protein